MPPLFSIFFVGLVGLAVLLYAGTGICLWLPREMRPYSRLVAPWAGYCVIVVVTQFLTNGPWGITALQSSYAALALVTPVNIYALLRWFRRRNAGGIEREVLWVLLIGLGVFVLGVLPLLSYGYTTIIGENWDAEIYMGLGEYLKAFSQTGLVNAAPNPILNTLTNPPYSLRTHGFSYFQAGLGFLPLSSLDTLAPLLALMRALALPAAYLVFRLVFRFSKAASLLASCALGANAFLLWITYNTFGMQVPALGLLPLAVCMSVLALRPKPTSERDRTSRFEAMKAAVWAGLLAAGIAVTYHPALTALAAMLVPLFLVLFVIGKGRRAYLLLNALIIVLVGVLLSAVSQVKSFEGFLKQYSEKTNGLGLTGFISPADGLGFSLRFRDLLPADPGRPLLTLLARAYDVWGWAAFGIVLLLIGLYILRIVRGRRENSLAIWEQIALLGGALLYLLAFVRPLNYPYGWFKALSFISFLPLGAVTGGLFMLAGTMPFGSGWVLQPAGDAEPPLTVRPRSILQRLVPLAVGIVLVVPLLATTWLTVGTYWGAPLRYNYTMLEAVQIRSAVPGAVDGKSVFVGSSPNMQRFGRLYYGVLSYFLRGSDLYGHFQTANSKLDRERLDGLYNYTLLHADDDPSEYGVAGANLVWHNSILSLYGRSTSNDLDLYHHNFRPDGTYPAIAQGGTPLTISLSGGGVGIRGFLDAPTNNTTGKLQFTLGLATLATQTLHIEWPGEGGVSASQQVVVPPGYTLYRSPGIVYPAPVRLSLEGGNDPASRVYVRWVHMEKYAGASGQEQGLSSEGPGLIADVSSSRSANLISLDVGYLNNRPGTVSQTLSLDIYGKGGAHFGYWNFSLRGASARSLRLLLDPAAKRLTPEGPDASSPSGVFAGSTGDGVYSASLLVYEGGAVSEAFNDIFTFTIQGGRLVEFRPRSMPPLFR